MDTEAASVAPATPVEVAAANGEASPNAPIAADSMGRALEALRRSRGDAPTPPATEEAAPEDEGQPIATPVKPAKKPTEPAPDLMASRLSALTAQEVKLQKARQDADARVAEAEKRHADLKPHLAAIEAAKSAALESPVALFEALSLDEHGARALFDQMTDYFANGRTVTEAMKERARQRQAEKGIKGELEAVKAQLAEKEKAAAEREAAAVTAQARSFIREQLSKSGDTYELSLAEADEAIPAIHEVADKLYAEGVQKAEDAGETPNLRAISDSALKEAMERVEAFYTQRAERYSNTKKIRAKYVPAPAKTPPPAGPRASPRPQTLTNSQQADVPVANPNHKLSEDQKHANALSAFRRHKGSGGQ